MAPRPRGQLSIGALAAATGIPADTIRTWERRYGFPQADRKPSGHRLYPLQTVSRLRRIAQALARGHRAAEVVSAPESALEALLAALPAPPADAPLPTRRAIIRPDQIAPADPADLLESVRRYDGERLKRAFQLDWVRFGSLEFLEQRAAPFLTAVGQAWSAGTLDVRHEHFGSAILGDFLRAVRMPIEERATGPIVALATLPGELHGIGLQMAALVFSLAGWRPLVLGVETPAAQIVGLIREAPIAAVALSVVRATPSNKRDLAALRRRLASRVPLLVGGAGAARLFPRSVPGVSPLPDLLSLDRWAREHLDARPSRAGGAEPGANASE